MTVLLAWEIPTLEGLSESLVTLSLLAPTLGPHTRPFYMQGTIHSLH